MTETVVASAPTGSNGWYTTDVEVDFTATDAALRAGQRHPAGDEHR